MASIVGSDITISVLTIKNLIPMAGNRYRDITPEGVMGRVKLWVGFFAEAQLIITTQAIWPTSTLGAMRIANHSLEGEIVGIVDDFGGTWGNIWVDQVRDVSAIPLVSTCGRLFYAGSHAQGVLVTEWSVQPLATSYP